jgi:acetylornithine deacetylase/succinyl-diaminopimelate desuccinylase-like protein
MQSGVPLRGSVLFAATVDDETAGVWGMKHLKDQGFEETGWPAPTFHVVGEPTGLNLVGCFKGRLWIRVETAGLAAHGGDPSRGVNAIDKMVRIIQALPETLTGSHPLVGPDTFNVGTIQGGEKVNLVADRCQAALDLRIGPPRGSERVLEEVKERIEDLVASDGTFRIGEIDVFERKEPVEVDPRHPDVDRFRETVSSILGRPPEFGGTLAAGDLYYTLSRGEPGIYFGPGHMEMAHRPNEFIDLEEVRQACVVYAAAIADFLG